MLFGEALASPRLNYCACLARSEKERKRSRLPPSPREDKGTVPVATTRLWLAINSNTHAKCQNPLFTFQGVGGHVRLMGKVAL